MSGSSSLPLRFPKDDARLAHVIRGDLNFHFVARDDANEVFAHLSANVGENLLSVG